jgi:hypothetical protein
MSLVAPTPACSTAGDPGRWHSPALCANARRCSLRLTGVVPSTEDGVQRAVGGGDVVPVSAASAGPAGAGGEGVERYCGDA